MKKLLIILALIMTVGLFAVSAQADKVILNNTYVQSWSGFDYNTNQPIGPVSYTNPNGNIDTNKQWHDVLGAINDFQTHGGTITSAGKLIIDTNWGSPSVDGASFTTLGAVTADLFIDKDPANDNGFEFAIGLRSLRLGNVYHLGTVATSKTWNNFYFPRTGATYGGAYGATIASGTPPNATMTSGPYKDVPVEAGGSVFDTTSVIWTIDPSGNNNHATIDLVGIDGFDPTAGFAALWATGTCANDLFIAGAGPGDVVPLPGAVLLLGAGLARLAAYVRKRRQEL